MTEDDRQIITARLKELDSQSKVVIVLIADLRRHFDEELQGVRNQLNTMIRQNERIARAALDITVRENPVLKQAVAKTAYTNDPS